MEKLDNLKEYIVSGKLEEARLAVSEAIKSGVSPAAIINDYLIEGMKEIDLRFEEKYFSTNDQLTRNGFTGVSMRIGEKTDDKFQFNF